MLMFKAKNCIFALCLLSFSVTFIAPAVASSLYDVEIPVTDESADARWGAIVQGMREVFVRISGDSIILDKLKQPQPTPYVKQYRYEPNEDPLNNADGEPLNYILKVQFNGSLMEKYLLDNGMPVWSEHRPNVVFWLAVRDGRNEYVLKASDASLIKAAAESAMTRRGVPEKWPLYDQQDKKQLSVVDIRGGFKDPVLAASKRYSRGPALTGSMMWNGREWQSSWSLLMSAGNRHWSLVDSDYTRLIDKAVDQAADALGTVFAVYEDNKNRTLTPVQFAIDAIDSIERYRQVEDYLSGMVSVDHIVPLTIDGQSVLFEVMLRSDERDFVNLIKNDTTLVERVVQKSSIDAPQIQNSTGDGTSDNSRASSGESQTKGDLDPVVTAKNTQEIHYFRLAD